jgi:hypothetical protein
MVATGIPQITEMKKKEELTTTNESVPLIMKIS